MTHSDIEMIHFDSDYMNLCHPLILKRMAEVADTPFSGYGADSITRSATEKIKALCQCPGAEVYFLIGGTQTNMVVIDALLKPWEGVLCAGSGHIAVHEAGAIESTGHKVLTLEQEKDRRTSNGATTTTPAPEQGIGNGKLSAKTVENYLHTFYSDPNWEHMVAPGMVYLTHPTECGTVYTLRELEAIHHVCQTYKIPLYIDGARLGYGLAANTEVVAANAGDGNANKCDDNANKGDIAQSNTLPTLADIARLADAFYIGGTKCGAMYGEAVVFPHPCIAPHFFTQIKRHGALLAKGWAAALQFDVLFSDANRVEDTLYYRICRHGVEQAARVRAALIQKGYRLMPDSPTNQLFVELTQEKALALGAHLTYGQWEPPHGNLLTIRFATSWATKPQDIDRLIELM